MFRYLKAAFWAAPEVAGLGRLPANAVAVAGVMLLGFGHPGFWLLGLALETGYLFGLTASPRFRRLVDAREAVVTEDAAAGQRQELVAKLGAADRARLGAVDAKCAQILQLDRESQTEEFVISGNRQALDKLTWLYLKLLVACANLQAVDSARSQEEITRQMADLQTALRTQKLSPALAESKQATLRILEQRQANLSRREQTLAEIESDLTRIEAQVDLALDNAGMRGKGGTISANIDLVSQLLDDSVYGDSSASIAELERTYQKEGA